MTRAEVVAAILAMSDKADLSAVYQAFRQRSDELTARIALQFVKGDTIEFEGQGRTIRAVVETVNAKSLSVRELEAIKTARYNGKWRVAPSLCRKVP